MEEEEDVNSLLGKQLIRVFGINWEKCAAEWEMFNYEKLRDALENVNMKK